MVDERVLTAALDAYSRKATETVRSGKPVIGTIHEVSMEAAIEAAFEKAVELRRTGRAEV